MNYSCHDLAWAAGILEGEGSFSALHDKKSGRYMLRIDMKNTDIEVVRGVHEVFGVGTVRGPYKNGPNGTYKPIYAWAVSKDFDCLLVISSVWDWLSSRRKHQAQEAIRKRLEWRINYRHPETLKRFCPQGHPYDAENTYLWRNSRKCKVWRLKANRRNSAKWRARKKAQEAGVLF